MTTQDYYARGDKKIVESEIEELEAERDILETAFQGVQDDLDTVTTAATALTSTVAGHTTALAKFQRGTDTLSSGTKTVAATITANSRIFVTRKTTGGTAGAGGLEVTASTRTPGTPGSFVVNSVGLTGTLVSTDTSTFDWLVVD